MIIDRTRHCRILHGFARTRCVSRVDKKFVGYFSVQFIDAGEVELSCNDRAYVLREPAFWFCLPGPRIRFHPGKTGWWSHRYFAFNGTLAAQWLRAGLLPMAAMPCPPTHVSAMARRMDEIEHLTNETDSLASWQAVNTLESLLLEIRRLGNRRKPTAWADLVARTWRGDMAAPPDYAALSPLLASGRR